MAIGYVYLLPILLFITMSLMTTITYIIAVALGHVRPLFPYISDDGTFSPESCLFSLMSNICAGIFLVFVWVRNQQVVCFFNALLENTSIQRWNKIGMWFGVVASFGIALVGNFQETNFLIVHVIGALFVFGGGNAYIWIQTYLSFRTSSEFTSRNMFHFRLIISISTSVLFLTTVISAVVSLILFHGTDVTKWQPEDGGYVYHVISAMTEWMLLLFFGGYMLSFVDSFRKLKVNPAEVWIDSASVTVTYEPLLCDGKNDPEVLENGDRAEVHGNIRSP